MCDLLVTCNLVSLSKKKSQKNIFLKADMNSLITLNVADEDLKFALKENEFLSNQIY
jgi:hypothetical protein